MKRKIFIIIGVILAIGILGGGIGLYYFFKPAKDFAASKADFLMNATELIDKMVKANKENKTPEFISKDKTVQVKGKVKTVTKNDDGTFTILLESGKTDAYVSCTIIKSDSWKVSMVRISSDLTVKGQVTGLQDLIDTEVIMIGCGIVN